MTAIELKFLANRYHGTAWGRHVNEGVAEWPPSPYRLLRAMYDAWKRKCSHLSDLEVSRLFTALASEPPTFHLPKAVAAHTRSYLNSNTRDSSDKSLIFDGFLAFAPEAACYLEWNMSLREDDSRTLSTLLANLNYLGRSESWIDSRLVPQPQPEGLFRCEPSPIKSAGNATLVACPVPASQFRGKGAWLDALAFSSGQMMKEKVSHPPALGFIPYLLPPEAVTTWLPAQSSRSLRHLSAALLELQGKVLPVEADTVRVAERLRGRLMRILANNNRQIPPMVHGKDGAGAPSREPHTHLFILPLANAQRRIDRILIATTAAGGFPHEVADAIAKIQKLIWVEEIRAVASWFGRADDQGIRPLARTVRSSTPFCTVRHWRKSRGSEWQFIQQEVRRECGNHHLPEPTAIKPDFDLQPQTFRRNREGDPALKGYGLRMTFPSEVRTPFALGYACHFGLGQFQKV